MLNMPTVLFSVGVSVGPFVYLASPFQTMILRWNAYFFVPRCLLSLGSASLARPLIDKVAAEVRALNPPAFV